MQSISNLDFLNAPLRISNNDDLNATSTSHTNNLMEESKYTLGDRGQLNKSLNNTLLWLLIFLVYDIICDLNGYHSEQSLNPRKGKRKACM